LTANSIERTALVAHGWRAVQPDAGAQLRRPSSVAATASVRMGGAIGDEAMSTPLSVTNSGRKGRRLSSECC